MKRAGRSAPGNITFVMTSPLGPTHSESRRLIVHGDGVERHSSEVDDVAGAYAKATARGAVGVAHPRFWRTSSASTNSRPSAPMATRRTVSSTAINIGRVSRWDTNRSIRKGTPAAARLGRPGGHRSHRRQRRRRQNGRRCGSTEHVMGFTRIGAFRRQGYQHWSILHSCARSFRAARPYQVPDHRTAKSRRRSQIEEYLDFYHGRVQHIAMATKDIVRPCGQMRHNDVFCACRRNITRCSPSASAASTRISASWPS